MPLTAMSLERGALALRLNAARLAAAAALHLDRGDDGLAFYLAEIAAEELGKMSMALAAAVRLACGLPLERGFSARLRSHERKASVAALQPVVDRGVAYPDRLMALLSDGEGRLGADVSAKLMMKFKNASLYVDLRANSIREPSAAITPEIAQAMLKFVEDRLAATPPPSPGRAEELAHDPSFRSNVRRMAERIARLPETVPY